ncbi:GNAT family N-acetyltransferase [Taklimakanibacter deserti]|uniref:GNAT family N-acetyltransferase n=1 Tax=Taklimakanibacter deserti TaxID=2267839 RepID=UPI000E657E76
MIEPASYSATEVLRDGRTIEIRALRPQDQQALISALDRSSPQSIFRRFLGARHHFTEQEISYFVNVDFVHHVALVAVADENGKPVVIGGGRYIVIPRTAKAELAFAVVDQYQRQGIGAALMRHLVILAHNAGLEELVADVLASNTAMLKLFENTGLSMSTTRESEIVHVALGLSLPA